MIDSAVKHSPSRTYAKLNISRTIVHHPESDAHLRIDRRTRKTRDALRTALFSLIVEKGYDRVTVQDILERANVGRSTFYTHFTDKHDAFRSGFDALCSVLQQRLRSQAKCMELFSFSTEIYRQFHEPPMHALYLAIKDHEAGLLSMQWLTNLVTQLVKLDVPKLPPPPNDVPRDAVVQIVVSTYLSLLTWSLNLPQPLEPERLDRTFRAFIMPALYR